ncbi:MAG: preprotein translocase subunit YajC [Opitutales bacterium]
MDLFILLAQGDTPGGGIGMFLPILLMLAAMYFLLFAPQRKKQKEHQAMVQRLQQGDEVMTNAGMFGVITSIKKERVTVRVADNVKVDFAKGAIQQNLTEEKRKGTAEAEKTPKTMPKGGEESEALEVETAAAKEK